MAMKNSDYALKMKNIIDNPDMRKRDTDECQEVRNYLMFRIVSQNSSRSGPIANLTISDMSKSEKQDGKRVVHVAKHKTGIVYGGALLNMSEVLYSDVWKIICGFRVILQDPNNDTDHLFIGRIGRPIDNSHMHVCLKSFARKTNVLPDK